MTTFKDLQHGTVNPFQPNTKAISYSIDKTLEQGVHKIDLITSGTYTLGLWLDDIYVGMFCDNSLIFELNNNLYINKIILKSYNDLGKIEYVKLVSGSNVTDWTPAPEDFNNLKGKSYALSQPLRKENILSLNGSFEEDDFIGLWLGSDKFVGFLDNQELTFDLAENYDDEFVVVKTLSEKGIIDNAKLEKGDTPTDWTPAPEDVEKEVNNKILRTETTLKADILLEKERILNHVTKDFVAYETVLDEETGEVVEGFKSYQESVASEIEQTVGAVETRLINRVEDVEGNVSETRTFFRVTNEGVEIGDEGDKEKWKTTIRLNGEVVQFVTSDEDIKSEFGADGMFNNQWQTDFHTIRKFDEDNIQGTIFLDRRRDD